MILYPGDYKIKEHMNPETTPGVHAARAIVIKLCEALGYTKTSLRTSIESLTRGGPGAIFVLGDILDGFRGLVVNGGRGWSNVV
jgi:hypothetical protein